MNFQLVKTGWVFVVLSSLFFTSCETSSPPENVEITIFHTNDLHLQLDPRPISSKNPWKLGGLAKLKTKIDQLRTKKPNSLLLDAGDWSEGSLFYAAEAERGMLRLLNLMKYSAVTVGNHDFLQNPLQTTIAIEQANPNFPVLGANKDVSLFKEKKRIEKAIEQKAIFEIQGVRVAVVGLLTESYFYYHYFKPGIILNAFETAARITKEIKNKNQADIIILLSHNDFAYNLDLAKRVPWVNVVVSGHSHRKISKPVVVQNAGNPVYVVEAFEWGQFLGELNLNYNRSTKQVSLGSYALHPIRESIKNDPLMSAEIENLRQTLLKKYGGQIFNDNIGHADQDFVRSDYEETPISNLAADAYRRSAQTDFALESVQLIGNGLAEGAVNTADLFNVQPHIYSPIPGQSFPESGKTWTLKRLEILGSDFKGLLNILFLANRVGIGAGWISLSGGQVVFDPGQVTAILRSLKIKNEDGSYTSVSNSKKYSVVFHDGILQALKIIKAKLDLGIDLSSLTDLGIEAWRSIADLVAEKKLISAFEFESGERYLTNSVDLSLSEHGFRIKEMGDHYEIFIQVRNESTVDYNGGLSITVFRGLPNDDVRDQTSEQKWTVIKKNVMIPHLRPTEKQMATLIWPKKEIPHSGKYPLVFEIRGKDARTENNQMTVYPSVLTEIF